MPVVLPISAFDDNYIWLIIKQQQAIVVDPGDAEPVIHALKQQQLKLNAILITHWHGDHTNGIKELIQAYPDAVVIGPQHSKIPASDIVQDMQCFTVAGIKFQTLAVPGHTLEHVAYHQADYNWLFSGDTLFAAGCGRVFEGTNEQMLQSLQRLASLPENTKIFCAHEYTLSNLAFALAVEPNNKAISKRIHECQKLREENHPTLPSTLKEEFSSNPFLRLNEASIITSAQQQGAQNTDALSIFTTLREWKNNF